MALQQICEANNIDNQRFVHIYVASWLGSDVLLLIKKMHLISDIVLIFFSLDI